MIPTVKVKSNSMKHIKIISMVFLSIAMLFAVLISVRAFVWPLFYQQIGIFGVGILLKNVFLVWIYTHYIPSLIFLIGFIFLLVYIARTKNIYSLCASLFLTTSIFIIVWHLLNIASAFRLNRSILSIVISSIVIFVFLVVFIALFFFFRSKSKKYIEVRG